eukprot:756653-Hanusia_phi.AAC.2
MEMRQRHHQFKNKELRARGADTITREFNRSKPGGRPPCRQLDFQSDRRWWQRDGNAAVGKTGLKRGHARLISQQVLSLDKLLVSR